MFSSKNTLRGFTLVEILMVIVIIAILGVFAIPRLFVSLSDSKNTAIKSILTSTRSRIDAYMTKQIAESNTTSYPTIEELQSPGIVLTKEILANPYNDSNAIRNAINEYNVEDPTVEFEDIYGWAYDESSGEIWANTNNNNENRL